MKCDPIGLCNRQLSLQGGAGKAVREVIKELW